MLSTPEKHALIAFGANQAFGSLAPEKLILAAFGLVAGQDRAKSCISTLYRTPCFPAGAGPDYVNAAAVVTLRHGESARELLDRLHEIEGRFGRKRKGRWEARTLDIDLLAVADSVWPDSETQRHWRDLPLADQARLAPDGLILPHPRIQDRAFVLVPLAEVAPHWCHPLIGLTVLQMLAALPEADKAQVVRLSPAASL